ncbi:MAG: hypothetical protein CFH41_02239 [Alphaproteobacteria bacterium MarineAlpha11_Bin1]|nr:MAG: hypothetical protein CFH41_02239 [Alphaproteobacteria bacterium MarineAlpha11_Bin1]|tara:strand:- start:309 stop:641 length:333 start_codon:yes stop_codon:yes gene_type:complete
MTASYIVRYQGTAANKSQFISHYQKKHAPILQRLPGIVALTLHQGAASSDPFPVNPDGNLLIAEMTFKDLPTLNNALASSARAEARHDFSNFPYFDGEVTHQAFMTERVF